MGIREEKDDQDYFGSDEFKRKLTRYEQMLDSERPAYLEADELTDIAEYYVSKSEDKKAEECIAYALKLHPGSTDPLIFKARQYMFNGDYKRAETIRDSIEDQTDLEVIYLNAELMIRQGHIAEANDYLHQREDPEDEEYPQYLYEVASLFADYVCTGEALDWVNAALRESPNNADATYLKAEQLVQQGSYGEAIPLLENLLNEEPYSLVDWTLLAEAYFDDNAFNKAIEACDFALAIDEKNTTAVLMKANCFFHLENYEEAHRWYIRATELDATDEMAYFFDGISLNNLGKWEDGVHQLLQAERLAEGMSSEQAQIYIQLSLAFSRLKKKEKAVEYIDKALAIAAENERSERLTIRGHVHLENGEAEEASADFREAMETSDHRSATAFNIATSLFENKRYSDCLTILQELEKMPEKEANKIYAYLAVCHLRTGHVDEALRYLKLTCEAVPEWTQYVLGDLFPDMPPSEYYAYAQKKWRNE